MKKLSILAVLVGSIVAVNAAVWSTQPLLNGYNLQVGTNTTVTSGYTNYLFTSLNGQVLYSLTNNIINGVLNTNSIAPDAFKVVQVFADGNGDINANASITVLVNQTNWIPVVTTNSQGQYYVSSWSIAPAGYTPYMYPATTNTYATFNANSTNLITFNFVRSTSAMDDPNPVWETSAAFSFSVTANGVTPVATITNLPTSFLQGAKQVKVSTIVTGTSVLDPGNLINGIWLGQWKP